MSQATKTYLGDGVYCSYGNQGFVLTTEDGVNVNNEIVMEPEVITAFNEFVVSVTKAVEHATAEAETNEHNSTCGDPDCPICV